MHARSSRQRVPPRLRWALVFSFVSHGSVAFVLLRLGASASPAEARVPDAVAVSLVETVPITTVPGAGGLPSGAGTSSTISKGRPVARAARNLPSRRPMIPAPPHEQELADPEGKAEQDEGHASYPTLTNPSAPTETFAPTRPPAELGGPPSARAGLPTQSLDPGVLAGVREAIQRQVVYPALARRLGWQGRATVAFHLSAGGQVENLRVLGSSGRDLLDSAALQAVARASPLPARGSPLEVVMPVVFALR